MLTATQVRNAKPGTHGDGRGSFGLSLLVTPKGARCWRQIYRDNSGRRVSRGLGSFPAVSLQDARLRAAANFAAAKEGRDTRTRHKRVRENVPALRDLAFEYVEDKRLRPETVRDWRSKMRMAGKIADRPVDAPTRHDFHALLKESWLTTPSASKALLRKLNAVMEYAVAHEWRVDNPLVGIEKRLPTQHVETKHQPAAVEPVAVALAKIDADERLKLAIEFCVLTAARRTEVAKMKWDEIDEDERTWTKQPASTKKSRVHRVPLSDPALAIMRRMRALRRSERVFGVSPSGMSAAVQTAKIESDQPPRPATLHGFRSVFKDWCRNNDVDELLSEFALAHVEGSATVAAYARDDLLDKRRPLMQQWADYVVCDS